MPFNHPPTDPAPKERRASRLTDYELSQIGDVFEARIKQLAKDGLLLTEPAWRVGAEVMITHGSDRFSLWVGRKIVAFATGVLVAAVLAWAVMFRGNK